MSNGRVLVVRPAGGAEELVASLESRGFEVVHLPLLAYETAPDTCRVPDLLAALGAGGWVALTSPRAVAALASAGPLPPGVRVAATGPATASALEDSGVTVALEARRGGAAGLVDAFRGADPTRHAVLWLAGDRALPILRDGLEELGHPVQHCEVYRTVTLRPRPDEVAAALDGAAGACFTSPSSVEAFVDVAPREWLARSRVHLVTAALGDTTASALRQAGFARIQVADETTMEALATTTARALRR